MPIIERTALVPFSAAEMYDLVVDVEAYPQFLPWCAGAQVHSQSDEAQSASVSINAVFSQTEFRTQNQLDPGRQVRMQLEDGPFQHLSGEWRFKPLGDAGCKVCLEVDFEFANAMVRRAIQPVFTRVCDSIVDAFIARAHERLSPRLTP